jgi:energy-converting hydrogenase Eha subunit A
VTDSISDPEEKSGQHRASTEGPDPAIGAGVTLLGIVLMGIAGARDAHYVFDAGVVTAVLGAATFVLFVALSAMKQKPRSS